jgi:hypothetical protein
MYSIWLVPLSSNIYRKIYRLQHIPHITVSTGHRSMPSIQNLQKYYDIVNFRSVSRIPRQYEENLLFSVGFPCHIEGLRPIHQPHLTLRYGANAYPPFDDILFEKPVRILGETRIADTSSKDPSKWSLV